MVVACNIVICIISVNFSGWRVVILVLNIHKTLTHVIFRDGIKCLNVVLGVEIYYNR